MNNTTQQKAGEAMSFTPRFPHFLHGGDYNPDQWLDRPDILERDVQLMQEAHVNAVSVGIFSWTLMEPEEGRYEFDWLDGIIDRLWRGDIHVVLATPSGARPVWMAKKYPEVLRVNDRMQRMLYGERHNHCLTSPVYREFVRKIDTKLAERYAHHPAVILWHLSNEYCGECRCELCQEAWRGWLKRKYGTIERLNHCWWTGFWNLRYTEWDQIDAPSSMGEFSNTSMWVDWRRFNTDQCKSFMMAERDAVQSVNPELKCTANLMEFSWDYDYFDLAEGMDVVSWDFYPKWHSGDDVGTAAYFAMQHDMMRSLKNQPFFIMESTPSQVNWHPTNKLKRPGMHMLSSMQAVAHGSQSMMYFQWRKGRGGVETFHGAVVDHDGRNDTQVFQDVTQVGQALERLQPIYDQHHGQAEVCILMDWENRWAIDYVQAGQLGRMKYMDTIAAHYRCLWEQGVQVDFRDMRECTDLTGYKLVVAPMLFMFRNGIEEKLRRIVETGGTLLMTYFSGLVDEHDLAFLGGTPHGLIDVLGLQNTGLDALYPHDKQHMKLQDGRQFAIQELCALNDHVTAETLGVYSGDYYAGKPCLTRNAYGKGKAYYLAAKVEQSGLQAIYATLAEELQLKAALPDALPYGVIATQRGNTVFVQNFSGESRKVALSGAYTDLLTGTHVTGVVEAPVNGVLVLDKKW